MTTTLGPIPIKVTRYGCPHCGRTASRPVRTREHMARCWKNPEVRGCKTCKHFEPYGPEWGDACNAGVDLTGRPACATCGGYSDPWNEHAGCTGGEIKPGPIVHCPLWQMRPDQAPSDTETSPPDRADLSHDALSHDNGPGDPS